MSSRAAICVDHLSKQYQLGTSAYSGYRTLRETLSTSALAPWRRIRRGTASDTRASTVPSTIWALDRVSLEVRPGEVVGIIGKNGAGKSTLLKILSRITQPTSGRVELVGRVGSLLEVGTGFHQELTGRENIYLNGAILGMSRSEIARKFDDIVAFSEVGDFLDTPVKRYSSGMYVRLAFAVASHLEPEILIVDEVLAVGDAAFQKKCLGRMNEISQAGRTVIFVSHNMAAVMNLCEKVAVLEGGRLIFFGETKAGIQRYMQGAQTSSESRVDLSQHASRRPGCKPLLRQIRLLGSDGRPKDEFSCGEPMSIAVDVDTTGFTSDVNLGIGFFDQFEARLFAVGTYLSQSEIRSTQTVQRVECGIDELPLAPGAYSLSIKVTGSSYDRSSDLIDHAIKFNVSGTDFYGNGRLPSSSNGPFLVRSHWQAGA